MKCLKCQTAIGPDDKFCGECGQAVERVESHIIESTAPELKQISYAKISQLYHYREVRPVRPLFWGYILSAHLNFKLTNENILEIIYPDNYFEYVHVSYEDNIASAMSMFYSNRSVSSDELNQKLSIDFGSANLITCQYPSPENQVAPEDLITGYLNGEIQDFMILSCLPYAIEVQNENTGVWKPIIDQFSLIPVETTVSIEGPTDLLTCRFRSQNTEIKKTVALGETIENTELPLFVDANYIKFFELPSGRKIYL